MNILLIGYGKMGQAIERLAISRGHRIVGVIDPAQGKSFDFSSKPDVAIEFTVPGSAPGNIRLCVDHGVPVLSGTTGWLSRFNEVAGYCQERKGTFFYASNYSLGVNIFFRLNEQLAKMMGGQSGYEISIDEVHHTQKKDAPSGTAITLAEAVLKQVPFKKKWVNSETGLPDDLIIRSTRVDPTPGTHTVAYRSVEDDIEIKHTAHSREGFARGALAVAEWLPGKTGVLGMNNFLPF